MAKRLSHVDGRGRVRMVDVSAKKVTLREAVARGVVWMRRETLDRVEADQGPKANVLATAHLAAVMAAKRTSDLIPLAHPVPIDAVDVTFELDRDGPAVVIEARVRTRGRTGVEMEALTAVAAAGLTLYDMLKAVDRGMVIGEIALWEKRGGRSGLWARRSAVPRAEAPVPPAPAKRAPSPGRTPSAASPPRRAPAKRPRPRA
jgi:cyclic pyranopterin monophosphate synthase